MNAHTLTYQLGKGWRCKACGKSWASKRDAPEMMSEECSGPTSIDFTVRVNGEDVTVTWMFYDNESADEKQIRKGDDLLDEWLKGRQS